MSEVVSEHLKSLKCRNFRGPLAPWTPGQGIALDPPAYFSVFSVSVTYTPDVCCVGVSVTWTVRRWRVSARRATSVHSVAPSTASCPLSARPVVCTLRLVLQLKGTGTEALLFFRERV